MQRQLLCVEGDGFAFRHALTREALVERLLPPARRSLAAAALKALDTSHPRLSTRSGTSPLTSPSKLGTTSGPAALSSHRAGRAGSRHAAAAIDALRTANELRHPDAALSLVEALALAGQVDEAVARLATP